MKKLSLSFILLLLIAFTFSPSPASAEPKIIFESDTHQFSEVESGAKIQAKFEFRNDGDSELVISEVKVTCDCTDAQAEPKELKPGEKGTILVTLDTSYRVGDLDKTIIVRTNDSKQPETTLHIKGKTWLPLTFKPSPLFLPYLSPGKESVADVTLMNTGKKSATIKRIIASESDLTFKISGKGDKEISLPYKLKVDDYIWIRVTLKAGAEAKGSINRQISVVADPSPITPLILKIQGTLPK